MRRFQSDKNFQKYKPHSSAWKRFWENRKRIKREREFIKKNKVARKSAGVVTRPSAMPVKRTRERAKMNPVIKFFLFAVVIVIWIYLMAYLPYFRITKIVCSGLENISKPEIEQYVKDNYYKAGFIFPDGNYFFINTSGISAGLKDKFSLESVSVKKVFPNELDIDVKEKQPVAIYDNGSKYFLLDANGDVVKYMYDVEPGEFKKGTVTITTTSPSSSVPITIVTTTLNHIPNVLSARRNFTDYPILYDKRNLNVQEKEMQIISPEYIANLISLQKLMTEQGIDNILYFTMDDPNTGVTAAGEKPIKYLFSLTDDPKTQIQYLHNTLNDSKPIEYVDLRYGNRVYWK